MGSISALRQASRKSAVVLREAMVSRDLRTEQGRAHSRHRAIVLTALASGMARAVSIATVLISVPLTLHYLGAERYGMWMTLSAFSLLLSFTDFGIGNSVLTAVSKLAGRGDIEISVDMGDALGAPSAITAAARQGPAGPSVRVGGIATIERTTVLPRL